MITDQTWLPALPERHITGEGPSEPGFTAVVRCAVVGIFVTHVPIVCAP